MSPVRLINRKLTKDKMCVSDFRHLNARITKNKLAFPLVRDTYKMLGIFQFQVLSVINVKDACHLLRLTEESKKYCRILPHFSCASYIYQRIPMGLDISIAIGHSYTNATLDFFQSRKYFEAIMKDLLFSYWTRNLAKPSWNIC